MHKSIRRLMVITGDHSLPDPTKREGRYHEEDLATHQAMVAALRSLDAYDVSVCSDHGTLLDRIRNERPDLVVNFCDTGFHNVPTQELHLPAQLELLGIPYTGAPPAAMVICYDKAIVRLLAGSLSIPVPKEHFIPRAAPLESPPDLLPALIKPNTADGSVGITKDAVVRTRAEAQAYLKWLRTTLPEADILVQEYLPGPEYGIGLIGNPHSGLTALPPLEVDFSELPAGLSPILSFESKAMPDSPYWTDIRFVRARLESAQEGRMIGWTRALFARLGLRDYGRFDFRVGADGEPKLMEVNPNPAWANDGKLALMAGHGGMTYAQMLEAIIAAAVSRVAG